MGFEIIVLVMKSKYLSHTPDTIDYNQSIIMIMEETELLAEETSQNLVKKERFDQSLINH